MIKIEYNQILSFDIEGEDIKSFFEIFKIITPERKVGFNQCPFNKNQMKIIKNMNDTRITMFGKDEKE